MWDTVIVTDPLPLDASALKQNGNRIYDITPNLTDNPEHKHAGWVYIEEDGDGVDYSDWHKFGEIEP
jgi:hypothetical protein